MFDSIRVQVITNSNQQVAHLLANCHTKTNMNDGTSVIKGKLGNLVVVVTQGTVIISGSLVKYYYGSNLHTLSRHTTQLALEKLSDELKLSFDRSTVGRIDFGANLLLKEPVISYLNLHVPSNTYMRNIFGKRQNKTVCFTNTMRTLRFYNKLPELKKRKAMIPEAFVDTNILRYEVAFNEPAKEFKRQITIPMLYDEHFYKTIQQRWLTLFNKLTEENPLKPMNDININTIAALKNIAVLLVTQDPKYKDLLFEILERSNQSPVQRSRISTYMRDIDRKHIFTNANEYTKELNECVRESIEFYR